MALSLVTYSGDGQTTDFVVPFSYISTSHVKALVDGKPATVSHITGATFRVTVDGDPPPAGESNVRLYRDSSRTARLVDFITGQWKTPDLDLSAVQTFYLAQEAIDVSERAETKFDQVAAEFDDITALEASAQASADAAAASESKAEQWADAAPLVQVEPGKYSAKHWADIAQGASIGPLVYRGGWDASVGSFPANPVLGDFYKITAAGMIDGRQYNVGDTIIYNDGDPLDVSGWDQIGGANVVSSVHGRTGDVVAQTGDYTAAQITETATKKIMTDVERAKLVDIPVGAQFAEENSLNVFTALQMILFGDPTDTDDQLVIGRADAPAANNPTMTFKIDNTVPTVSSWDGSVNVPIRIAAPLQVGLPTAVPGGAPLGSINAEHIYVGGRELYANEPLQVVTPAGWSVVNLGENGEITQTGFKKYIVEIISLVPATDAVTLRARTSSDEGQTVDSGASDYSWVVNGVVVGAESSPSSGADSSIRLHTSDLTSLDPTGHSFTIELIDPLNSALHTTMMTRAVTATSTNALGTSHGSGRRNQAAVVNALEFTLSSGNIASGTFKLYGVP